MESFGAQLGSTEYILLKGQTKPGMRSATCVSIINQSERLKW